MNIKVAAFTVSKKSINTMMTQEELNNPFQTNWIYHELHTTVQMVHSIWAATRKNLSLGFLKNRDSNQSPQLQRLPRKLKFRL